MTHLRPKSSYLRPQFSRLWALVAGIVCTGICAILAVLIAIGTHPLAVLGGSFVVVALIVLAVLCTELASRFIPYAQRPAEEITEGERVTLYLDSERRRRGGPPPENTFEAASPFGPPRPSPIGPPGPSPFATPDECPATDPPEAT